MKKKRQQKSHDLSLHFQSKIVAAIFNKGIPGTQKGYCLHQ